MTRTRVLIGLALAAAIAGAAFVWLPGKEAPVAPEAYRPSAVVALGHLEPGNRVIEVGTSPGRLAALEVRVGDEVRKGDALASLDNLPELIASRDARRAEVEMARLELEAVEELGPLEIEATEAELRRLEAEQQVAETDHARILELRQDNLVSQQEYDHQRALTRQSTEETAAARARLRHLRGSLDNQRHQAKAAWQRAEAQLADAEARLARARIVAPVDGTVLEILTWPGEVLDSRPILRMGETGTMYATAEVYETDLRFLSPGLAATASSPALADPLTGRVERIGRIIRANDLLSTNPAAQADRRVAEVRVRLDQPELAARLVNLQVDVEIPLPALGAAP
jgi:HlyD family secretion protein